MVTESRKTPQPPFSLLQVSRNLSSPTDFKKYGNVHSYLKDMFGEQFLGLVADMQSAWDEAKSVELQKRLVLVKNQKKLDFPDYNSFPAHVREVFEYFKAFVRREDLLEFAAGAYFREDIVNLYFKVLEKASLLRLSQYNYARATVRNSIDLYSQPLVPQRIMYLSVGFARKLLNPAYLKDCLTQLQHYFKHDQVLMPFFFDEEGDRRALVVSIKVADFRVDLYDREREHDSKQKVFVTQCRP